MKRGIIKSADGSYTLKLDDFDESYHSINGALSESMYIYIESGLSYYSKTLLHQPNKGQGIPLELNIFEVGFGTGLNALLTAVFAIKNTSVKINYSCVEKYPVTDEEFHLLNHISTILNQNEDFTEKEIVAIKRVYEDIQYSSWGETNKLLSNFSLFKTNADLLEVKLDKFNYDIIYFDAFSPNIQPELWTTDIFKELYNSLKPQGILVTYSSKGIVKQSLRESGFDICRLPGPIGKRHIIRATKPISQFECDTF